MKKIILFFTLLFCILPIVQSAENGLSLKAYYTRLGYDDGGYTGKYADVVVHLSGKGEFIFSREFSYQPFWVPIRGKKKDVDRIIERKGTGPYQRLDKNNICSNVAIVERTDSSVIVHWRYVPDLTKESFTDFTSAYNKVGNPSPFYAESVDEYYEITKNGVIKRTVKEGCYELDKWNNPSYCYTQTLKVSDKGMVLLGETSPKGHQTTQKTIHHKVKLSSLTNDSKIAFLFDDAISGATSTTLEEHSKTKCNIEGVKAYWDKGVSGSCLYFDSYSNSVLFPQKNVPKINSSALSLSVWIAPLEYPFNVAAIIDHLKDNQGYFLGLDRLGRIVFKLGTGDSIVSLTSSAVNLYDWTHVVARYNRATERAEIVINGKSVEQLHLDAFADTENADFLIGKTTYCKQYPLGAERNITKEFQTNMVFSGLIDDVLVFDELLSDKDIHAVYESRKPLNMSRLRSYVLPNSCYKDSFGANYTKLSYNQGWDGLWRVGKYADLVVTFKDNPWRFVFWRGTRYLPSLVTDYGYSGIWSNDQGPEIYPGHCYEHMSDMLCRFSNIRLISSSPARVIVHWRNASVDIKYTWSILNGNDWGVWTDEYWTIYPDGTSIRHQLTHNSQKARVIEMNQNEILHHPGQTTEDVLLDTAVVTGTPTGQLFAYSRLGINTHKNKECNLLYTNLNSSTKQFQIGEVGTKIDIHLSKELWWNGWNHYPCQLIPSDGTKAILYDRSVSSCPSTFREVRRNVDSVTVEAMQIYGLTQKKPSALMLLNRFWNFPPKLLPVHGCSFKEFVKAEKAYYLNKENESKMSFNVMATKESPIVNPTFVIENFKGCFDLLRVNVNGKEIPVKKGIEINENGIEMLVIWMEYEAVKESKFFFTF